MAARCFDKAYAREIADTARQARVIEELLGPGLVLINDQRIGTAGLAVVYWTDHIRPRMEDRGFRFMIVRRGDNNYIATTYPGEG